MNTTKKNHNECGAKCWQGWRFIALAMIIAVGMSLASSVPVLASNSEEHIEPLGKIYENFIVPKHRIIISHMDVYHGIETYRGQSEKIEPDLSKYGGVNTITTSKIDLSRADFFSQAQAFGVIPLKRTLPEEFMGQTVFDKVPSGVICTSYLTKLDKDGDKTELWLELTGQPASDENAKRIGRVKLSDIARPYYRYRFNADLSKIYAPTLDRNVAHNIVAWDWNKDGFTDWLVNYITNPEGKDDHKNMKVELLFIDGKSLYDKCLGKGNVKVYKGPTDIVFATGGNVVGGLTGWVPPNSVRMAIGDMDGDGNPEVGLYYTQVNGGSGGHNNHLRIIRMTYNIGEPKWDVFYHKGEDVGQWGAQQDSVGIAMGDLDRDGFDEMAVLHGKSANAASTSMLYLDIYKIVNGKVEKVIKGENVGQTSKLAGKSTPVVEVSIADLDGDGINELIYVHTEKDDSKKLYVDVHNWPVVDNIVVLKGSGNRKGYHVTDLESKWKMDGDYARFSMNTGMFAYPETDSVRKQIGIISTIPGTGDSSGIRWGIFTWNESTGLLLAGKGERVNSQPNNNVVPLILAADIDGDSMILGDPTGFTVYDSIEPIFIVQAPPRHWDTVVSDGEERIMDAFAVLNGYSTSFDGKTSNSQGTSTTKTSSGHWGVSAAYSLLKPDIIKPSAKVMDVGAKYSGEKASKNTESGTVTITSSLTAIAQYDDQIHYRANTHDVWRYPVLAPKSQTTAISEEDGKEYRRFIQYIVPKVIESSFASTPGKEVDWYQPRHNGLNLFSYPKKLEDTRDYPQGAKEKKDKFWKDINGTVLSKSTGQLMGNVDATRYNFTIDSKEHEQKLKTIKNTVAGFGNLNFPAWGIILDSVMSWGLTGDYSYSTDSVTTSDRSQLAGITVSFPGLSSYVSPSGMTPGDQQFTVDAGIYTSDSGTLSVAYAVSNLYNIYSPIWGEESPYYKTADPALNLPRQWVINAGKWQANPLPDSTRIRGFIFDEARLVKGGGLSGQVFPVNTDVHATMRVYNYSFTKTGNVTVTLSFQPITSSHDKPDITKALLKGSETIPFIPGRDSGTTNNWVDLPVNFTTGNEQTIGYLHVALTTDGGNLQTSNDQGQLLVGVYDPAKQSVASKTSVTTSGGARFLEAQADGRSLTIVADSMSVRPLNADGTLGSETTALDPGETAVVQAVIRFTDTEGAQPSSLLNSSAYLRNAKGFVSQRAIPMLQNGEDYVVEMLYTAPETGQRVPLQMVLACPVLPAKDDANPAGRIATKNLIIGGGGSSDGGSGGGCSSFGLSPAALLLALPLALLFRKR